MHYSTTSSLAAGYHRTRRLLEEIATLACRLEDMGLDGDCAYERAISRLYTGMIEDRKQQLAVLGQSTTT